MHRQNPQKHNSQDCHSLSSIDILDTLELTSEFRSSIYEDNLQLSDDGKVGFNLVKRAHSKARNTMLFGTMLYANFPNHSNYQKTYYCSHEIQRISDSAKSNFCKKRWCMICNRIRTAQLMRAYMPTLESWTEKHFLTLTIPNMSADNLVADMKLMYKTFTKIKDSERKEGHKLVGIRKLECTYNRQSNTYHPHYHILTETGVRNEEIIQKWLRHFPKATRAAQDTKAADNETCFELFKYFTKLTSNSSKDKSITIHALNTIFESINGVRTFQPFGFICHQPQVPPEDLDMNEKEEIEPIRYSYNKETHDWIDKESGECLTNYNFHNDSNQAFAKAIKTT